MNNVLVSIIIPTYNDWKRLAVCINALSNQTFLSDRFEIIVVNNNSHDTIPSYLILPANAKIIAERTPGSYAARNAGLRIAGGEIIGFTDSDCIPDKDWIKNAVEYLSKNKNCSRIAGKIEIFFKSKTPNKAELYDKIFAFNQKGYVKDSGTSVTANLFTYKQVFENIGYFDEGLMSGGDFLWGIKAHKNGYKIDYVDNVTVNHSARENLKELIKKERRVGGSQAFFLEKNNSMIINFLDFIKALKPHIGILQWISYRKKDISFKDKIYIFLLRQYLVSLRAYEKLKVQTGKKANRA